MLVVVRSEDAFYVSDELTRRMEPYLTDDRVRGVMYRGAMEDFVDPQALAKIRTRVREARANRRRVLVFGVGATLVEPEPDLLVPAGTVHCSAVNTVVLEVSATPYNFTFKMWDWGRLGLDGLPRPIHLDDAEKNICWERRTDWCREQLVNAVTEVASGDGWREEHTGLHELEFIETRRITSKTTTTHETGGGVHMLNLVDGEGCVVESPARAWGPFVVHYAETFVVPAACGTYTLRPERAGSQIVVLQAYVRL